MKMLINIRNSITFLFCITCNYIFSQFSFEFSDEIPVTIGMDTLKYAWAGGLNNVQVSTIDYDFDGDEDLFIFDRSSNNIRLFSNEITNNNHYYKFIFNGKSFFPNDLYYRVALVDYNNDSKKDIFTYGIGGIKVYRNEGNSINGLQWSLFSEIIYSDYSGNSTNLFVSSSDIPAIVDVDLDGDIDILTFSIGGQHVEYHQNQSIEEFGIPDSLKFILKNECWGKFMEDAFSNTLVLNDPNYPCINSSVTNPLRTNENQDSTDATRHSGSTILALDYDHSSVLDLIVGDVSTSNLSLLINGGSSPNTNSAIISIDSQFPSNSTPVDLQIFPAAFLEDVDFDNKKDIIVSGNARNSANNEKGVWFYKNINTSTNPVFSFQSDAFLQNEMIENGSGSIPVFFDYDQDGLEDLFISNFYRYKAPLNKEGSIAVYKNNGDLNNPSFTFIDDDFLNLSQAGYNLRFAPTFGDIDNDGDKDMFLGLENGTIAYYENLNSASLNFASPSLNLTDNLGNIINTGSFAFPQLFDLNKDGLIDLIIGKNTGEILYYQNIGTAQTASFQLVNSKLGNIDVNPDNFSDYPTPHFFNLNDTTYLFLGEINGQMYFYDRIENQLSTGEDFHLINSNFLNLPIEAYSSFCVNDIDHDGKLNLLIGQDLGGLYQMEVDPNSSASVSNSEQLNSFSIYPNPSNGIFKLEHMFDDEITINIIDLRGKTIYTTNSNQKITEININQFDEGYYFVQVSSNKANFEIKKIAIFK